MSARRTLVSLETLAGLVDGSVLTVPEPYVVTPSAAALARLRKIEIRGESAPAVSEMPSPEPGAVVLPSHVESTLLDATATPEAIEALCDEARQLEFAGVCVAPCHVERAAARLDGSAVRVVTVAGFPLGSSRPHTKAFEAARAAREGAVEIDMVISLGHLIAGEWRAVHDDILAVRRELADPGLVLKAIIEAPVLEPARIVEASILAVEAGADYVKTGTGFRGTATPEHVRLIRRVVGGRARIKAAGGIRSSGQAQTLLQAGADRLGSSAACQLLAR